MFQKFYLSNIVTLTLSNLLGCVFSCNKKSKGPSERIGAIYNAHFGPVYALQRNPCFPKVVINIYLLTLYKMTHDSPQ